MSSSSFVAWITSSLVETTLLYPLDVAITRRQTSPVYVRPKCSTSYLLSRLYQNQALYNGFIPHLASTLSLLSMRYSATDSFDVHQSSILSCALTGATLGAVEGTVLTPFEAFKIPLQISNSKMPLRDVFKTVTVNGTNYRSLFRGFVPTVSRQSIYGAITFTSVKLVGDLRDRDVASGASLMAFCSLTGIVAAILGHPFDVIKARSQSLLHFPVITKRQLFAGLSMKLWRVSLGTCAVMVLYDELLRRVSV